MSNREDIVTELRDFGTNGYMMRAADEIELLRSTVTNCRIEIECLAAERDAARRDACEFAAILAGADNTEGMESGRFHQTAMKYMRDRGWDCFREDGK